MLIFLWHRRLFHLFPAGGRSGGKLFFRRPGSGKQPLFQAAIPKVDTRIHQNEEQYKCYGSTDHPYLLFPWRRFIASDKPFAK